MFSPAEATDDYPHKQLCYDIVGCALRVLNSLGNGFHEKPYENALAVEFRERGWRFKQQPAYPLYYHDHQVGEYIPDFVVENAIIVDPKVVESIGNGEVGQMLNYLKVTRLSLGLLLNFRNPQLEWRRVIQSEIYKKKLLQE